MQTGEQDKAMIYIDMLRKTMKEDQQKETAQDLEFQRILQQFGQYY